MRTRTVPALIGAVVLATLTACGHSSAPIEQAALIGPPGPPPTPLRQQIVIATSNLAALGDPGGKYSDVFAGVQQDNRAGTVTLYVTNKARGETMADEVRSNHPEAQDVRIDVKQCRFTLTSMSKTAAHILELGNAGNFAYSVNGTSVEPDGEGILVTASAEAAASPAFRKQLTDAAAPMKVQFISAG